MFQGFYFRHTLSSKIGSAPMGRDFPKPVGKTARVCRPFMMLKTMSLCSFLKVMEGNIAFKQSSTIRSVKCDIFLSVRNSNLPRLRRKQLLGIPTSPTIRSRDWKRISLRRSHKHGRKVSERSIKPDFSQKICFSS